MVAWEPKVRAAADFAPDVAFVDIGMPSLDGVEAVRRVRGQGNTQDVLLVAVTGRGGAEDRARAAEAGFVLIGRASHGEGDAPLGVLTTLWPFLAGYTSPQGMMTLAVGCARH